MDVAGFEEPQQLWLHLQRGFANLVEEQCAAGRRPDDARGMLDRAGEGAA
jgi:hypothetical protein